MKQKLAILLWATDPATADRCATPFFHAAAAGAMDVEVEMYFTARSVLLLAPGAASRIFAGQQQTTSIGDHMRQASEHGVRFFACQDALTAHGMVAQPLIEDVSGYGGATAFIARALDPEWATLVY
ncbi:MAG: DsrE family protein [Betaproteobacteria bacterium]|nr:DsrE family protein [Betaproteobacteria bacterium]